MSKITAIMMSKKDISSTLSYRIFDPSNQRIKSSTTPAIRWMFDNSVLYAVDFNNALDDALEAAMCHGDAP